MCLETVYTTPFKVLSKWTSQGMHATMKRLIISQPVSFHKDPVACLLRCWETWMLQMMKSRGGKKSSPILSAKEIHKTLTLHWAKSGIPLLIPETARLQGHTFKSVSKSIAPGHTPNLDVLAAILLRSLRVWLPCNRFTSSHIKCLFLIF